MPFKTLSPTKRVGAFNTFNSLETRSLKRMPRHPFKTFKDLELQGTTFKARR